MTTTMANKIIISCAITGSIHTPTMSDALPITPDQIATQAIDAAKAGAAGTFTAKTSRLAKATYRVLVTPIDKAGNAPDDPVAVRFTV